MNFPNIDGLEFKSCCEETIKDIRRRLKNRKILQGVIPIGLFATLFLSSGKGAGSILSTYWSVGTADFITFARAMQQTNNIGNPQMRDSCAYEAIFNHSGGKLHEFWKTMLEIF